MSQFFDQKWRVWRKFKWDGKGPPLEKRDFHENVEVDENGDDSPYLMKVQMWWQKAPLLSGGWLISKG